MSQLLFRTRNESGAVGAPERSTSATPKATSSEPDDPPNGALAAAFVAAGVACAVFGALVVLAETFETVKGILVFGQGAGPLSGKAIVATAVYGSAWLVLHWVVGQRTVDLTRWLRSAIILIALGLVTTFPPVFQLFEHEPGTQPHQSRTTNAVVDTSQEAAAAATTAGQTAIVGAGQQGLHTTN